MTNLIDPAGNATGYEIDLEDSEYLESTSAHFPEMRLSDPPPEIDYGHGFSIRNQGNRPSCRGHSLATAGRMGARIAAGGDFDLDGDGQKGVAIKDDFSPLWCWVKTQVHGGTVGPNRGATMGGGVKAATQDGFAREVVWPYSQSHTTRFPAEVVADAQRFKFKRQSTLRQEEQVYEWLASGQGPCEWGKGWPFSWIGGCLVDSGSSGRGGHATAIRGYWTGERVAREVPAIASRVRAEPYVYVCENSHGANAQWRGLYFVTRRGMAATLAKRDTHLLGWSDLEGPFVRKFDWSKARLI